MVEALAKAAATAGALQEAAREVVVQALRSEAMAAGWAAVARVVQRVGATTATGAVTAAAVRVVAREVVVQALYSEATAGGWGAAAWAV